MQSTPSQTHQSIYRETVVELYNKIGLDYVAWMEDTAAQIFERYTLCDIYAFTETFGPHDENPFVLFAEWSNSVLQTKTDPYSYFESQKESQAANQRMRDPLRDQVLQRHKRSRVKGPADAMLKARVKDPYPGYLRPWVTIQTAQMMRETINIGKEKIDLPEEYRELGPDGKYSFLSLVKNPLPRSKKVNQDDALKLHLEFTDENMAIAKEKTKLLKTKIEHHIKSTTCSISENPIWSKWENQSKSTVNAFPQFISATISPKATSIQIGEQPEEFINTQNFQNTVSDMSAPSLPSSRKQTENIFTQSPLINCNDRFVEDTLDLGISEKTNGDPRPPLTPTSTQKDSLFRLTIEKPEKVLVTPPSTIDKQEQMPGKDDDRQLDSPSLSPNDINRFFAPIRSLSSPLAPFIKDVFDSVNAGTKMRTNQTDLSLLTDPTPLKDARRRYDFHETYENHHRESSQAEEESFAYAAIKQPNASKIYHKRGKSRFFINQKLILLSGSWQERVSRAEDNMCGS
nr:hypothetical protein L204_02315 [Cryptococcus depauperatus CBS 7855]